MFSGDDSFNPLRVIDMLRKLTWGAMLFIICTSVVFASTTDAIPTQAFFEFSRFSQVKISPDGRYLAVVSRTPQDETKTELDFVDLSNMKVKGNYSLVGEQLVAQLWWVSDQRVVFTTATQTGSLDAPLLTGDIWAVNVDGGNLQTLAYHLGKGIAFQYHYNHLVYVSPDSSNYILVADQIVSSSSNAVVYKINVNTAKKHEVMISPILDGQLFTDNNGDVRLAYGVNLKTARPKLLYRDPGSVQWLDITSLVAGEPSYTATGPVMFTADNKQFYYEGYTPQGTLGLYLVDPHNLKKTLLYSDPDFDIDNNYSATHWLIAPDHKTLVAFEYMGEMPEWILLNKNAPEAQLLTTLLNAFPGQNVQITSVTGDGNNAVVYVSSDRNPGIYYLYDTSKHQVRFLFSVLPDIKPEEMATMQPITFKARDGLIIHGYLTLPVGESKNLPLIINPHGGPFGIRDEWGFDPEVQFLAAHDYAVLQVNYHGSGGYGAAFQETGYRQWGGMMQDDITDATEWSIQQGIADPKRICIYGGSYGGYAAIEAVVKEPELYQCAIGYAGVYDLVRLYNEGDTLQGQLLGPFLQTTVGDDMSWLKDHSPVDNVAKIKAALFLAHGGADHTVPIKQAEELRAALDKVGKQYDWLYYPNEGHGFFRLNHKITFYTDMLNFFNKHIGPGAIKH
ncbi:MAG TPA: S9 family peptidase [Gammaproteobacteria bacterium]|nr:S9 family peptidase [Gammaproteobacteria bacterium]